jgi:adenylate cyclase, class 2
VTTKHIEIEVKLRVPHFQEIKQEILSSGFHLVLPNTYEHNILFDTPDGSLKKNRYLLRLRKVGNNNIITFKRPTPQTGSSNAYKIREEIEIDVSDFEKARTIFSALGLEEFFIYEKYREVYENDQVKLMMDHTPIGDFLEIEGEAEEIDKIAVQLGYSKTDYITDNYLTLFRKEHKTGFMQFQPSSSPPSSPTPPNIPAVNDG